MRPRFEIRAGSGAGARDITARLEARLMTLTVADAAGIEADRLTLTLDDRAGDADIPRKGQTLEVALGWHGRRLVEQGRWVVDGVDLSSPPSTLRVSARSADLTASIKAPRTRDWRETTVGAIVAEIAAAHGLAARVAPALAGVAVPHMSQTSESDLHLLTRLARRMDALAKIGGGAIVFAPRGAALTVSGKALPAARIAGRELSAWRWRLEDRGSWASCAALWHDFDGAGRRRVETSADLPQFEIGEPFAAEDVARRAAHARLAELRRGALTLDLDIAVARPEIFAETPLDVSGLRDGVDGRWIASRVEHRLSPSGFTTRIEAGVPVAADDADG